MKRQMSVWNASKVALTILFVCYLRIISSFVNARTSITRTSITRTSITRTRSSQQVLSSSPSPPSSSSPSSSISSSSSSSISSSSSSSISSISSISSSSSSSSSSSTPSSSPSSSEISHVRRVRYKGKYPKNYHDKYKELSGDSATIEKVKSKGSTPAGSHLPIMVNECLEYLGLSNVNDVRENIICMDCTLGFGGHTMRILSKYFIYI
jgi:hypothetical protein